MRTELCESLGIEFPIFAFTHCRDVVAAVSNAAVAACDPAHAVSLSVTSCLMNCGSPVSGFAWASARPE